VDIFPTKILLATDGSEDAAVAARAAADLSSMTDSELHVVHAWRSLPQYAYPSLVPERYHPPHEEGARKILARQVEQVREAGGSRRNRGSEARVADRRKPGAWADQAPSAGECL
jgi:nucleotide-binding universal stress UspA family protein